VSNEQASHPLDEAEVEARLMRVLNHLGARPDSELSVVITDDPAIALLNEQYLGRVGPTNVLAFPQGEGDFAELTPGLLGDVVVSLDTARREANENRLDETEHFYRLLIHGLLHLIGYDHLTDEEEAARMEELTEELLEKSACR